MSAFELERATHLEEPWLKAREGLAYDVSTDRIIKKEWMMAYYGQFVTDGTSKSV